MLKNRGLVQAIVSTISALMLASCQTPFSEKTAEALLSSPSAPSPYLYIASGATYAGNGITPASASNTIVRYSMNGSFDRIIYDYNTSPGDQPVQLVNYDSNSLLVLIENAGGGRRVDKVAKDGSGITTFISNAAITGGIVRSLVPTYDGGWLVSRSGLIEKFNSARARVLSGATSWITAPAGSCATSTTLIPSMVQGPSDHIIFAHSATGQNRLAMVKKTGYAAASDCLAATAAPTTAHFPTTLLNHSSGKLFAAYANATGAIHQIYAYDTTASTISAGTLAYSDPSVVQGVTSMVELPDTRILVASGSPTFNSIEMFQYDSTSVQLLRVGTTFIAPSVYTKSISSMLIAY